MPKLELGLTAKDKITGFTGILVAKCEFLHGVTKWCIQPKELVNGSPVKPIYYDEVQIEVINS